MIETNGNLDDIGECRDGEFAFEIGAPADDAPGGCNC